jgi:hypothetical protein
MPKYGIHFIVLEKVKSRLEGSNDPARQALGRILGEHKLAASVGCIGPDLLFWAPDYALVESLRDLVTTYDTLRRSWETLEEFADAIEDHIEEGVDAVLVALEQIPVLGPVLATVSDYHDAFEAIDSAFGNLAAGFRDEVAQALFVRTLGLDSAGGSESNTLARSLFHGLFQSTQQAGREEMDWYWFEMLHYRRTGAFAKALIRNAEDSGDEEQMAYAYAYATHYAADLVGHPFVNTISGSPYRINVQRHVVIENFMDQWKWGTEFEGTNIRNDLFSRMGFDTQDMLPDGIATLIAETLSEVYGEVAHPLRYVRDTRQLAEQVGVRSDRDGFLTVKDVHTAFVFQKLMLEFLGGQKDQVRPTEPYPGADGDLADLVNSGGVDLPPAPGLPPGLPSSAEELLAAIDAWLAAVAAYVDQLVDAARQAMSDAMDALEEFLDNPADELLKRIQLLAYAIQLLVYNVYRMIHQVLALAGLSYPEPDDAALSSPIAESLITTRRVSYKNFPILRTPGQPHLDTRSYVPFLATQDDPDFTYQAFENPETIASHYVADNADTPDGFIDGVPLDVELLSAYASAATPAETRALQQRQARSFGNAVDLSIFILDNRADGKREPIAFCDWNLDGDRGYGYKAWEGVPFTVWPGEIDDAINGNEPLEEVVQQNYAVWTRARESEAGGSIVTAYENEVYVGNKPPDSTLLAALNISEHYIPAMFMQPARMSGVPINRWVSLVPPRFRLSSATLFSNIFFCNGATTTPSSGMRCTMALQKTLNASYQGIAKHPFRLRHLHNYSSPDRGDLFKLSDLIQAIPGDYLGSMQNREAIVSGSALRDVTNPTEVAVIALLHHGMERDMPLVLSGHSQGTMITANAVMVFSSLGNAHRDYLRHHVKLFHMEPELIIGVRELLRDLVKEYLVYIMNDSDPAGTDLLVEATSGPFPLIPGQPGGLIATGSGVAAIANTLANPNLLDITFYQGLAAIATGVNTDVTALIGYTMNLGMAGHYMPVQLPIIATDITADRFRTDPGTLANPTVQLSTPAALNGTSVAVRPFFLDD